MDYLPSKTAKKVVELLKKDVVYIKNLSSARCPLCGGWGNRIYCCTRHTKTGRHRYFVCAECGFRFKAVET